MRALVSLTHNYDDFRGKGVKFSYEAVGYCGHLKEQYGRNNNVGGSISSE